MSWTSQNSTCWCAVDFLKTVDILNDIRNNQKCAVWILRDIIQISSFDKDPKAQRSKITCVQLLKCQMPNQN